VGRGATVASWNRARVVFAVVLTVQLVLLYWPRAVQTSGGLPWDKLVHVLVFGAVTWTGVRAGVPPRAWIAISFAHAVTSEVVQHALLPHRAGDPGDAVADVVGVLVAALLLARFPVRDVRLSSPELRNPADGVPGARE
jgi:hypothetical protein